MPAEVLQVIRTDLDMRGEGIAGDPMRRVTQFWSLDGELLAEVDDWAEKRPPSDAPPSWARYTEAGRKVFDYALREALSAGHNYIDPSHIKAACDRVKREAKNG